MIESIFRQIAEEEGGQLQFREEKLGTELGATSPHLVFKITVPYKGASIYLKNATGTQFYGFIQTSFDIYKPGINFELNTISHFSNLFLRKNSRLKVDTQSKEVLNFFDESLAFEKLKSLAKETVFEPHIIGENTDLKYSITTKYSLQFTDWTRSIQPLIKLQKEFIDFFI